jgi:SAM-dependent methyltransferase
MPSLPPTAAPPRSPPLPDQADSAPRPSRQELNRMIAALPESMQPQASQGVWPMALEMLPAPGRILNAGAGRGGMSLILRDLGFDVVSLDLHPEHFQAQGMQCRSADFLKPLELESDSLDAMIAVEVIEHLENPWHFLREAVRVLKVGGSAVLTSPNVASLWSRWTFLRTGVLHYFRDESFFGCYHVTPIFPWAMRRFCHTASVRVAETRYSRVEWPRRDDVPRWPRKPRRAMLSWLPRNGLFGEITGYRLVKTADRPGLDVGHHYA